MGELGRLLLLSDLNLAEAQREHARWVAPYHIEEHPGLLLTAGATRSPVAPLNAALRIGPPGLRPEETIARARAFFSAHDRGFALYARAHLDGDLIEACERAGFPCPAGSSPGMVLTSRVAPAQLPKGVTCRAAESPEDAAAFRALVVAAWENVGLARRVTERVLSRPEGWLAPHWHVRILREGERPVAGAMLLLAHGIAGVYWVATRPEARGRGHASAVMREISNWAFDHGAAAVVLQASAMGEPVYRRLGYREITRYPWYLVAPAPR